MTRQSAPVIDHLRAVTRDSRRRGDLNPCAARNVRAGAVVFGQGTQGFLDVARALEGGAKFPELILVGAAPGAELVVLEGHVRLTAYFLAPWFIPEEVTTIMSFSPALGGWMSL
jgi:hypothetical protein